MSAPSWQKQPRKLHVQQAATELQNIALKSKLESHPNKSKRERIEADANTRFANIETIKRAQDKVAGQQEEWKVANRAREAKKTAERMLREDMSHFQFEFRVDEV